MDFLGFLNKLLGDPNEKELKRLWPRAHAIRALYKTEKIQKLTMDDLPKKTEEFKKRLEGGATVNDITDEAFAVVLRACDLLMGQTIKIGRQEFIWNMAPFDVQILGGLVLHKGNISEMKTGEGKTLVCTLPVYLNALEGKGVHVVTVNDYLAKRDSQWMGLLYKALGLSVGVIVHGLSAEQRRAAYGADITYGTNNEFGFDYLRDNMALSKKRQVQRGLHYAIVDEVDSILVDEARTPLIISQPAEESTTKYGQYAMLVSNLEENKDFNRDEKQRTAVLTEEGIKKMEGLLGVENIYTERGFEEVHHIEQALRAHAIYKRDVDYVVKDGEIIIVDEFTGRLMPGRRYSHGLHQAIEAKEKVTVQRESKTLATITFQNYFRLYKKLAGMTGTAKTEEEEFESIYRLRTIVIPTHHPLIREDTSDAIYRTVKAKFMAVAKIAKEKYEKGQPVLIGTTSIEKSEALSLLLNEEKVPHQVLNAKQHEKEAEIVAQAGQRGAITIATNMAGRGTDIKLGVGVAELGGLVILGTERHEARRIDNQLRGRSGRHGDPGESQFFVSMEDDLMRLFGGDRLKTMMERLKVPDDVPLENNMVSRAIESAQKKVEGRNFDIRRHVLQYDNVMNKHREIIYMRRQKILEKIAEENGKWKMESGKSGPLHDEIVLSIKDEAKGLIAAHASGEDSDTWNRTELRESIAALHAAFAREVTDEKLASFQDRELLATFIEDLLIQFYEQKCAETDPATVDRAEAVITLRAIDAHWMDHIDDMSHLREQVAFSGYAQRDPLIEYQDQGFRRFQQLITNVQSTIVRMLLQADFAEFAPRVIQQLEEEEEEGLETNEGQIEAELTGTSVGSSMGGEAPVLIRADGQPQQRQSPPRRQVPAQAVPKVGRNDPCPCGSGKKYKKCHGKDA
ncbi:preprotein translocase subunit SecA [Candidatus Peregrinibacteria bacterium]|nr:preprotein translocase subunit SecA [Candidatus Peregrinibacteria bacterium]